MHLRVLHVDNHVLVVLKPPGVPTVPDASGDESLLDAARAWIKDEFAKPGKVFLGVVHRLDRPISGVVVLARTSKAARRLAEAFRARSVEKEYWGVSDAAPREAAGRLETWLAKDAEQNRVRAVGPEGAGKQAITRWRTLGESRRGGGLRVLLELVPETGRPHQLRHAAASLGAPLLGDLKYGAARPLPDKSIALHARRLVFPHPTRDELLSFTSAVPPTAVWSIARELAGDAREPP